MGYIEVFLQIYGLLAKGDQNMKFRLIWYLKPKKLPLI
jgi:hypothetical protein